jgi:hypothetical protein
MRQSSLDAALIVECAKAHSVSSRSVRTWRIKQDPRWRAWVQRRASDQGRFTEIDFEVAGDKLTPAQEEEQALRRYAALASLCDAAIARGDNTSLQPLLRSTGEAHKLLYAIRENRAAYEERMRDLVPASEVTELFRSRIEPVKAALQAMPKFLASQIDPVHPDPIEDMIRQEVVRILYAASGTSGGDAPAC